MDKNLLHCTLVQQPLVWESVADNLRHFEKLIAGIAGPRQLVLLPETFATGFTMESRNLAEPMDGPIVQWMRRMASTHRIVLGGSVLIREGEAYYNRFIWMQPDGHCHRYNKRHLFAYGNEARFYQPGEERVLVQINGWKLLLTICYDLRFPVWSRQQQKNSSVEVPVPEYDVLINVANWPATRHPAWEALLKARAIENQCFVVAVNRVGTDGLGMDHLGGSLVYGPLGEILHHSGAAPGVHTVVLNRDLLESSRLKYPFLKDADAFTIF